MMLKSGEDRTSRLEAIAAVLRERIIAGVWQPGERLPRRSELEQEFGASTATLQRVFDALVGDGFVETRPRQGSFVAPHPPHRYRYALAIPGAVRADLWNRFWQTLRDAAAAISRETDRQVELYAGIDPASPNGDYPRLLSDIENRRLAGIVFAHNPYRAQGTPVLEAPNLPRVVLQSQPEPGFLAVGFEPLRDKVLDFLAGHGRRRVALITLPWTSVEETEGFRASVAARGMETRTAWIQAVDLRTPRWVRHAVELLLSGPPAQRPDALFLTDDNLMDMTCRTLSSLPGLSPADLDLVSHACLPAAGRDDWPVHILGYDIRQALDLALERIDAVHRGEVPAAVTTLAPQFASERRATAPRSDPFAAYAGLDPVPHAHPS